MDDAEVTKLTDAIAGLINMEAPLRNLLNRGNRAAKFWAEQAKTNKSLDAKQKKQLADCATQIAELTKDAKVVLKDIDACFKDKANRAVLDRYPTAKEFRDKVLAKRLASARSFDQKGLSFVAGLVSAGQGGGRYPGKGQADPQGAVDSCKDFSHYYNQARIELAQM